MPSVSVATPFAASPVCGVGGERFEVVAMPSADVTVREAVPGEAFRGVGSEKGPGRRRSGGANRASRRPTRIERPVLARRFEAHETTSCVAPASRRFCCASTT
jgi:hypothetical protein